MNAKHYGNQDDQGIRLKGYFQENCKMMILQSKICSNFTMKLSYVAIKYHMTL